MPNRIRKEDMIAGPYNPKKDLSFVDTIVRELGRQLEVGSLSPKVHSYAVDLARRIGKQLTNIYGGSRHGLAQALELVLRMTRNRLP